LTGKDGILTPLIKQLTEAALKAEAESHLEADETPNRKNGYSRKTSNLPRAVSSWRHPGIERALLSPS
jgi:transposase-like protein